MSISEANRMTLDVLRSRLRERIETLTGRLDAMEREKDPRKYTNVKVELTIVERRLKLLNEKVKQGE